jgi:hypothetical protein
VNEYDNDDMDVLILAYIGCPGTERNQERCKEGSETRNAGETRQWWVF